MIKRGLSSRILSLVLPIAISLIVSLVFFFSRKPLLSEIFFALIAVSAAYFLFVFICLVFNIGIKKEKPFDFSEIPGLTKNHTWFKKTEHIDTGDSIDLASGADDPLGLLIGALITILMPLILGVTIFLVSGGIEILLFLATYVCYYSVIRVLRMQLAVRRKTKFNFFSSLSYAAFYTLTTIGLLPIGLGVYSIVFGKTIF